MRKQAYLEVKEVNAAEGSSSVQVHVRVKPKAAVVAANQIDIHNGRAA